jgi:NitT/TauT family transport system substrate-binding protein
MITFRKWRAGALAGAIIVAMCGPMLAGTAQAQEKRKVVFALNYSPTDHHIAYWVALDKGYYAREGLDVELQNSKGSGDAIAKLDIGRADFALGDVATLVPAIARGAKAKIVGIVFNTTPLNFVVWKDSAIKTPKDLEGKTVGSGAGDAPRIFFPAFAKVTGIDTAKVSWVTIDSTAKVGALLAKRVDAVADFTTVLPLYEKAMGEANVRSMPWADQGFKLYSLSIIARDETIAKDPDLIKRFLKASYEGWRDAIKNPQESIAIFKKHVAEIDTGVITKSLDSVTFGLVKTPDTVAHGIGWINKQSMCDSVKFINDAVKLARPVACSEVYNDALLPTVKFR